ncbi:pentapeptide repeat-containing protein [Nonomuraea sp. MTCD27]|uniref:pentapeptide repeat-containing protein n=1 Tax=Nonomuraea sp. MTCD27 TaxID=1676747 RepID=UPI0035C237AD
MRQRLLHAGGDQREQQRGHGDLGGLGHQGGRHVAGVLGHPRRAQRPGQQQLPHAPVDGDDGRVHDGGHGQRDPRQHERPPGPPLDGQPTPQHPFERPGRDGRQHDGHLVEVVERQRQPGQQRLFRAQEDAPDDRPPGRQARQHPRTGPERPPALGGGGPLRSGRGLLPAGRLRAGDPDRARLRAARLRGARLRGARFRGARFRGGRLPGSGGLLDGGGGLLGCGGGVLPDGLHGFPGAGGGAGGLRGGGRG